jgi:circadian clock protein KaiC
MDTWIVLANDDVGGYHRRGLYVLKSRGMAHSNELREFALTDQGLHMLDAAAGARGTSADVGRDRREGRSPCSSLKTLPHRRRGAGLPVAALRRGTDAEVGPGAS